MIRSLNIVAIVTLLLVLAGACTITPDTYTIATVNDQRVTLKDIQEDAFFRQLVDNIVTKTLFLDEASSLGISIPKEKVDEEVQRMKENFGSEEAFIEYLETQGRTVEDLRDYFEYTLTIMEVLKTKVEFTEEEVRSDFELNPDFYRRQYSREYDLTVDEAENLTFEDMKGYLIEQYQLNRAGQLFDPTVAELRADADIDYVYLPPEERAKMKAEQEKEETKPEAEEEIEPVPDVTVQEDGSGEEPVLEAEEAAEEAEADAEEAGAAKEAPDEGDESATENGADETEANAEDATGQEQSGS